MHLWLERRDLMAETVRVVVPNSTMIQTMLSDLYPAAISRLTNPVTPGVSPAIRFRKRDAAPPRGGVIGFIGFEWKRKGLDKAIDIVKLLAVSRPELMFVVAGPSPHEIASLFSQVNFHYELAGRVDTPAFLDRIDLLLHPALIEPFGMVIAEALTAGTLVVISDRCGIAANISTEVAVVLPIESAVESWARVANDLFDKQTFPPLEIRTWDHVAQDYEHIYRSLSKTLGD